MKDQECIMCKFIFECKGKPDDMKGECLNYKERRSTYNGNLQKCSSDILDR